MAIIKQKLCDLIKEACLEYSVDITVLQDWTFPLYKAKFPLATVRVGTSSIVNPIYGRFTGREILWARERGDFVFFTFSIHIFAKHDETAVLKAKTAQDIAMMIYKYLLTHSYQPSVGMLDIVNVTMRESEPATGGTLRLSRVIMEGIILAFRPVPIPENGGGGVAA